MAQLFLLCGIRVVGYCSCAQSQAHAEFLLVNCGLMVWVYDFVCVLAECFFFNLFIFAVRFCVFLFVASCCVGTDSSPRCRTSTLLAQSLKSPFP